MNNPVNFEIAKLLKEKGFNEEIRDYYEEKDGTFYHSQYFRDNVSINEKHKGFVVAPTIAEVVMWLYEKHDIWISVDTEVNGKFGYIIRKYNSIDKAWETRKTIFMGEYFSKPVLAYQAAIDYCLNYIVKTK